MISHNAYSALKSVLGISRSENSAWRIPLRNFRWLTLRTLLFAQKKFWMTCMELKYLQFWLILP